MIDGDYRAGKTASSDRHRVDEEKQGTARDKVRGGMIGLCPLVINICDED